MARKWFTFSWPSFIFIFQEIRKAMEWAWFLRGQKRFKNDEKMHFDVLPGPFVDGDQASRRVSKIVQNDAKMHLKSLQNEHEIVSNPMLQWSKTHTVVWPAKTHENAFIFVVPGVALLTPWMQNWSFWPQNRPDPYESFKSTGRPGLCALLHFECPPRGGSIRSVFENKITYSQ